MAYQGFSVPIPLGQAGIVTDDAASALPLNALQKANNVSVFGGAIEKSLGTSKVNATALDSGSAVVSVFDWFPTSALQRLIALTASGKLYRDTGDGTFTTGTAIKTGLGTLTPSSHMVEGGSESAGRNKKLFIFPDGQSQVQVISGDASTTTAIALPSADWATGNYPTYGIQYQNRMMLFGSAADRHRVYASTVSDHENFVGPNFGNSRWELWARIAATPNVDKTAAIQAGTASTIFTTTNNDGYLVYGVNPFNKVTLTISTAASGGSPVYTYEYWNGSAWTAFTPTALPNYAATGSTFFTFTSPSDWAAGDGTEVAGNTAYYAIRVLATTASSSTGVSVTSVTVTNTNYDSAPPTFPVFPGEGEGLMCAAVYRGLLFVFKKPYGVYIIDGRDPDTANWRVSRFSDSFGVASPHAIAQALGDLVAANSIGSYTSLQASEQFGDFEAGDILQNARVENYVRSQLNFAGLPYSHSLYWPEKKLLMFTGQSTSTDLRDRMLLIDLGKQSPRILLDNKERPNCLALRKNSNGIQRPMYGAADGFVYLMEQSSYSRASSAYLGEFQTVYSDFGQVDQSLASKNKIFDFVEVGYVPTGNNNFYIDVYVDGDFRQTLTFNQYFGIGLDAFELDSDSLAGDPQASANRKPLKSCTGKKISFRVYNNNNNEAFKVDRLIVSFRVSGEQVYAAQV